jgi:AraC-like DNA-binding protein
VDTLPDGGYAISDIFEIEGEGSSYFIFGRGWLLEIVDVTDGEYYFYSDGKEVRPDFRPFAVFYPTFTMVKPYAKNVKGTVNGVGSIRSFSQLPRIPMLFKTDFRDRLTSVDEAIQVLAARKQEQSIEVNTKPSLLSMRAKRLIDENFLVYPSIGRIAKRLDVSHEHLSRQFKRDFGLSPSSYLHQLRISEATYRLSLGEEEIIDISGEVGYNDLSRFYKQFRKATQTSPAICRNILRR